MKNTDKIVNRHKGMLICLWDAVTLNNASAERYKTTGTHEHSQAIKNVVDAILEMPDYTFKIGQVNRLKIDNETHINVTYKNIYYKGGRFVTIYYSRTTNHRSLIDVNTDFLMTEDEKADMKNLDKGIDKFLQSITSAQNKLIENN